MFQKLRQALTKKIVGCDFSYFNLQDLEAGIHWFGTIYRSPQSRTKLQQALLVYDNLRKGTGTSLLNFQVLRETEKFGIPYSMTEVTYCFKSLRILLHALLRLLHILVQAWNNFASMCIGREAGLSENLDMHQFVLILFVLILCWPANPLLITNIMYEEVWEPSLTFR